MTAGEKKSFHRKLLPVVWQWNAELCDMFFEFTVLMTLGKKHVCTMYNIEMGLIIQGLKLDFVYIEMILRQG